MIIHKSVSASDWVLVMSHGFRGSKDGGGRAVILADKIAASNINVVRYDFTPLQNITTQVAELTHVVEYAKNNIGRKIVLLGRSMGGCASLIYTARHQDMQGLCLWSTPANLQQTFRLALGKAYDELLAGKTIHIADEYGEVDLTPDLIRDFGEYDLHASIRQVDVPVLVLHGGADAIVPLVQAQRLFTGANEPKKIIVISDGDHQFSCHAQQAQRAVLSWLNSLVAASI